MELGLSLGETSKPALFSFLDQKTSKTHSKDVGFCMGLSSRSSEETISPDLCLQLPLLPFAPVPRNPNRLQLVVRDEVEEATSSPNSTVSSFRMDFGRKKRDSMDVERGSDDEENGSTRKKLRLSKEQSAFLEESFKEHSTLNPKQKLALSKQLNLRPRQVEVWFQNRRARTKLKQTEVDCEYLKRCCETLTEENKRLHKEVQELRALKTTPPFYMHLPATTLTMCPSCERVVTTSNINPNHNNTF